MSKVNDFKEFVKGNPSLIKYIKNGEMSWQKFYEIYDIYGEDNSVWNEYLTTTSSNSSNNNTNTNRSSSYHLEDIIKMAKNIDVNKVQDSLTSLQKTLSLFGEILGSKEGNKTSTYNPRPLYRKFED